MHELATKERDHPLHGLDWLFPAVLALVFLIVGATKAFRYGQAMKSFPWVKEVHRALVQFIGIAEMQRGPS